MELADGIRTLETAGTVLKHGIRSFTNIDTNPVPGEWTHITKVDPEPAKKLPLLYPLYLQHTSAISVGGSRDVTSRNTEETFELLDAVSTPAFHEPSDADHVTATTRDHSEFLAIPEVLNGSATALVGTLGKGAVYLRDEMVPGMIAQKAGWLPQSVTRPLADFVTSWLLESAVFEAYIIQNPESAAAREADVTEADRLGPEAAAQRALAAEKHLDSPIIYLEYSGTYGGEEAAELLAAISEELSWSRLWYGGGIASRDDATTMLEAGADTVVVGDVFHRVADEEAELWTRARDDLTAEMTESTVRNWLQDTVDVEATTAVQYLSTIPSVADPVERGREYLTRTLLMRAAYQACSDGDTAPSVRALREELERRWEQTTTVDWVSDYLLSIVSTREPASAEEPIGRHLVH